MTTPRQKGEIRAVGQSWPHEPDELGRTWTAAHWHFNGGDFPGWDGQIAAGWTMAELALIADLAAVIGPAEAMRRANQYRAVSYTG